MKKHKPKHRSPRRRIPKKENVAAIILDRQSNKATLVTKDLLTNQIYRFGPRIAASFDALARSTVVECSAIVSVTQATLYKHLPNISDKGSEATCARLLFSATNSYVAAIEVARRGYPRELGALMRIVLETIATALAIAIEGAPTLKKFHDGKLQATKCISTAKSALPFIGQLNGMLSNDFVHVGALHTSLEGATNYTASDERLKFVALMMKLMALLLDMAAEVIFAEDIQHHRYWKKEGLGWTFEPTEDTWAWIEEVAPQAKAAAENE